ncbi:MAG: hypothetical protein JSS30_00625 [Verrucomicrobia bacterium]|nr:hypothetical protein [Verrucomicrobiota bacterium]
MDIAVTIAKTMGPILILLGLWFILVPEIAKKGFIDLEKSTGFQFLYGLINLLVGFFIVSLYNIWESNIFLSVTLLGWVLIVRGFALWFKPDKFLKSRALGTTYQKLFKFIVIVWGAILLYAAYAG